ncbi:MAG TPA: hypothetical protein DIC59_02610 [Candidatus Competibacteraceae bacterium]|nr:hypothetical protein [Candidatus Competibacteraceae bacterium]
MERFGVQRWKRPLYWKCAGFGRAGLADPAPHQVAGDSTVSAAKRICSALEQEEVATMMANV